jgi:hypothetical protein
MWVFLTTINRTEALTVWECTVPISTGPNSFQFEMLIELAYSIDTPQA